MIEINYISDVISPSFNNKEVRYMKIRFIDSKNRMRIILGDYTPETILKHIIISQSEYYGPLFEEKISDFIKTLPEAEVANYKKTIAMNADKKPEDITDEEVLTASSSLIAKYMRWLDINFSDNPDRLMKVDFTWNPSLAYKKNNYGASDIRKMVSYRDLKNDWFAKLDIDDGGSYELKPNNEVKATLVATRENLDILAEKIAEYWNKSVDAIPEGEGNKKKFTEVSPSEYKELQKSNAEEDKEELEILKNPEMYTAEDVKKVCYNNVEPMETMPALGFSRVTPRDSQPDWCGVNGVKLFYNFENSKLIKDNKPYDYFAVNKELEKCYQDSKPNLTYEEWIKKNPSVVIDTLDKMNKEEKSMNDSLKNLKFRFKDGVEIEVLDSEGKSFAEVKDEAIQVHRQMVKKQMADADIAKKDEKETEEVLEEYGAKATNDSLATIAIGIFVEKAKEAFKAGTSQEDFVASELEKCPNCDAEFLNGVWELAMSQLEELQDNEETHTEESPVEETPTEDSIEKTSTDKFQVIVNGKEIGVYDTYEEAEEAEKKALEAVEKGIPKVEVQDTEGRVYEDDTEQAAYENALDCLTYGVSKADWNSLDLPDEKANEIWKKAFKDLAEKM